MDARIEHFAPALSTHGKVAIHIVNLRVNVHRKRMGHVIVLCRHHRIFGSISMSVQIASKGQKLMNKG